MEKQCKIILCLLVIFLIVVFTTSIKPTYAANPAMNAEEFYKGKTIKFIVPFKPGGGYDYYPRLISPYLKSYTGATVIVKNMPAVGGIYGTNYVYSAEPDGLTLAIIESAGIILAQLFGQEGVRYDYKNFNWLGRTSYDKRTIMVAKESPYHTIQDIMNAKSIKVASVGKIETGGMSCLFFINAIGVDAKKIKPIPGYGGSQEATLALEQKEVDMYGNGEGSAYMFQQGGIGRVLIMLSRERSEYFPNVPTVFEQTKIPEDREWPLATYIALSELHRGIVMPPGVPQDRVDFMRDAIMKCLSNKELLAKAKKAKREISPLSGTDAQKLIKEKLAPLSQEKINEMKRILLEKYY